ncbi:hypothetical protein N658DRAFT_494973 [Parathielavia hyrcaniae]|uniref:Uncharacterized protein n=1 Tax=Parathielavia hyrcaniae TaxID=113614 RepID=A0AAN6Q6Z5_9PEZI|nr:hypothetical protein N658DRAFT_494973 [Parathielavia hyrcaniae]
MQPPPQSSSALNTASLTCAQGLSQELVSSAETAPDEQAKRAAIGQRNPKSTMSSSSVSSRTLKVPHAFLPAGGNVPGMQLIKRNWMIGMLRLTGNAEQGTKSAFTNLRPSKVTVPRSRRNLTR